MNTFTAMLPHRCHERVKTGSYAVVGGAWEHELLALVGSLGIRSVIIEGGTPTQANHNNRDVVVDLCRNDAGDREAQIAANVQRLRDTMATR